MHGMILFAATLLAAQPAGARAPAADASVARLSHCVIRLIDDVDLPAQEEGVLAELTVQEGAKVTKDQVLGRLDDSETLIRRKAAEAKLAVATEKATNDAEVQVARKIVELAKAEYEESVAINARSPGSIPETQLRRQRVQWEKAVLDAVAADMNFKIAGLELKVAEAELEAVTREMERRALKAPFDGVVTRQHRQEAEWVRPGEPILRVVRMDRLRVEGFLRADEMAPEHVQGAPVTITLTLVGGERVPLPGRVDYVSDVIEAAGDYRVWTEIDNPAGRGGYAWLMRPGGEAEMEIRLNRIPASTAR